jgi:hypothetical protein
MLHAIADIHTSLALIVTLSEGADSSWVFIRRDNGYLAERHDTDNYSVIVPTSCYHLSR